MLLIAITNTLQDCCHGCGPGPSAVILHQARLPPCTWGFHGNFQSWGHLPTLHLKLMSIACIALYSDRKIRTTVCAAFTFFTSADRIFLGALITESAFVTMIDVPSCFTALSALLVATIPISWDVLRRRNICQERNLVELVIQYLEDDLDLDRRLPNCVFAAATLPILRLGLLSTFSAAGTCTCCTFSPGGMTLALLLVSLMEG